MRKVAGVDGIKNRRLYMPNGNSARWFLVSMLALQTVKNQKFKCDFHITIYHLERFHARTTLMFYLTRPPSCINQNQTNTNRCEK